MFSHHRKSSQETLSDREDISSRLQSVQGRDEIFFTISGTGGAARLVLEERRDHLRAEALSESLKQECTVDRYSSHFHS